MVFLFKSNGVLQMYTGLYLVQKLFTANSIVVILFVTKQMNKYATCAPSSYR